MIRHISQHQNSAVVLLLVYWALNIPLLGGQVARIAWQYPKQRNLIRRLLEPLGSADLDSKESSETPALAVDNPERGAAIVFDHVTIRALGHTILRPFGRTRTEQ